MEIRKWHCYLAINCALIIPLLSAKPFSLNNAIAAESKSHKTRAAPSLFPTESTTRFSLNKAFSSEPAHKLRKYKSNKYHSGPFSFVSLPSLKTKRLSEITDKFKSRSLSDLLRPLQKRNRQSKKREVYKNGNIDEKYFPLFRNLGLLFDNLLNESGDSYEINKKKHKRRKDSDDARSGVVCSCALKSDAKSDTQPQESKSHKKTIIFAKTASIATESYITSEKATAAPTTTDTPLGNVRSVGQDKDLPSLFPRDSSSGRRNHNGYSERSRSTFHRSAEGDITRNSRNRKHYTRNGKQKFSSEYDEEDTDGSPRNDATCDEYGEGRGSGGNHDFSYERDAADAENGPKIKKTDELTRGHFNKLPRKTKLKIRRNETESKEYIPKYIRGIRGSLSENKIGDIAESIQSEEDYAKSLHNVPLDNTSDKRFVVGGGAASGENQEIHPGDETVISINDISNLNLALQKGPTTKVKAPSVSIIDGYSVARDKNGQNKLTEKSIRIHVK